MPPRLAASATSHASSQAGAIHQSQGSERLQSTSPGGSEAPQAQPSQAAQPHAALSGHDPALLEEKMQTAGLVASLDNIIERLQAVIATLRQTHVRAAPDSTVTAHAGNPPHDAYQPNQPQQPPVWKKRPMAYAIERAYERPGKTLLFGLGALAVTAGTFGLIGLGGLGLLGVSAVCGIASFGLLGAGLYGGYKYHSNLLSGHPNGVSQPPPATQGQNAGSWVNGHDLPALQRSNRGHGRHEESFNA